MRYGGPFHPSQQPRQAPHPQHPQQHPLQSPSMAAGPQAHHAHPRHGNGIPGSGSNPLLHRQPATEMPTHSPDLRKMTTPATSAPLAGLSAAGGSFNPFPATGAGSGGATGAAVAAAGHFQPQGSADILSRNPESVGQVRDSYLPVQALQRNMNPMATAANFRHHPAAMNPQVLCRLTRTMRWPFRPLSSSRWSGCSSIIAKVRGLRLRHPRRP